MGASARHLAPAPHGRVVVFLALLCGLLACGLAPARAAPDYPALTGRVVDAAHILDPATITKLEAMLADQEGKTSDQLVVATIPALGGMALEDYANGLFRAWKIGQEKKNNGVLLVVAPHERKVRIEVGYGLEGIITDAVASTIIRNRIIPDFKAGDMAGGIVQGTEAIIEILNLDPDEARARARKAAEDESMSDEDWVDLIFLVLMIAVWIYILWRANGGGGSGGRRVRRSGRDTTLAGGPISTWDWDSRGSGGWSSGGGGWSGGGGSSGGGGASGSW